MVRLALTFPCLKTRRGTELSLESSDQAARADAVPKGEPPGSSNKVEVPKQLLAGRLLTSGSVQKSRSSVAEPTGGIQHEVLAKCEK